MKKRTLILFALLAPFIHASARDFYIKAGGGYSFPLAGQTVNPSNNELYSGSMNYDMKTGNVYSFTVKSASMAAGIQGFLGAGISLNENIAIELSAHIGISTKKNASVTTFPYQDNSNGLRLSITEKYTMSARIPILLSPAITVQSNGKIKVYTRAGLLLPVKTSIQGEFSGTETAPFYNPLHYAGVQEYKTKLGIGFTGAIGISANTAIEWLKVWAEADFSLLSLYATERSFKEYSVDGQDRLGTISPQVAHVYYDKENTNGTSKPSFAIPFNSAGAQVGVAFIF